MINSVADEKSLADETTIRTIALFDNEEVGSSTAHGADSNLLLVTLKRLSDVLVPPTQVLSEHVEQGLINSFLVSADMAHALHPNCLFLLFYILLIFSFRFGETRG